MESIENRDGLEPLPKPEERPRKEEVQHTLIQGLGPEKPTIPEARHRELPSQMHVEEKIASSMPWPIIALIGIFKTVLKAIHSALFEKGSKEDVANISRALVDDIIQKMPCVTHKAQANPLEEARIPQQYTQSDRDRQASGKQEVSSHEFDPVVLQKQRVQEERVNKEVLGQLQALQTPEIASSQDLGGHRKNLLATVTLSTGQTHHLFLKPRDETEARNYAIIQKLAPKVAQFMPRVYGEVRIGDQSYLVLANTRMDANGSPLKQLADTKLAGKISRSDFNPIADQEEMRTTRGEEKGWFDYTQMQIGAASAPHYMSATGAKLFRIFNYHTSEGMLLDALEGIDSKNLQRLKSSIKDMYKALAESPIALIGASVIFVKQSDGTITPLLIDPAHMQVDPTKREEMGAFLPDRELSKVYFGKEKTYEERKASNAVALAALTATITAKQAAIVATTSLPPIGSP